MRFFHRKDGRNPQFACFGFFVFFVPPSFLLCILLPSMHPSCFVTSCLSVGVMAGVNLYFDICSLRLR